MKRIIRLVVFCGVLLAGGSAYAQIKDFVVNPAGSSIATMYDDHIDIHSFVDGDMYKFQIEKKIQSIRPASRPLTIIYSSDSKYLIVSGINKEIYVFDTKQYELQFSLHGQSAATEMDMSPKEYFIAAATGNTVDIWNVDTKTIQRQLSLEAAANGVAFSSDGSLLAVTTQNNKVIIYNTVNWEVAHTYDAEGSVAAPAFNAEDKYLALVINDKTIAILDFCKKLIVQQHTEQKKVNTCNFYHNVSNSTTYVGWDRNESIIFMITKLEPSYTKMVNQTVNQAMNDWLKKREDESPEDYANRVNDETMGRQRELFRQEFSTAIAGAVVADKKPDEIYRLNECDEFVLSDGIPAPPPEEDNFVPLAIVQIANEAEDNLKAAAEEVIKRNKASKLITDKTEIRVGTEVMADVDAEGNKILNYQVNYKYVVFANGEDYPPGGYNVKKSNAAMSLMTIVKQTLESEDFVKHLSAGKRVKIAIIGSADGAPIRGKIPYDGSYGAFEREPYYHNGKLNNITITKASGITTNPQLAYIRTASVRDWLSDNVATLQKTRNDYQSHIEVSEEKGGEFRKIEVQFTIIDAFK
ncbi:hypothetical protein SAMD00024442_23_3 [Candidatus Symbiothrix dinenymphae]|nr:hypothetical protein SAMD00024442_23_3 [Candidatus Symbiothrix dinenymphae]